MISRARISRSRSSGPGLTPDEQEVALDVDLVDDEPGCVTRVPPMRPGIFVPLNTRDGYAEAPIEPGLRTLCEPCETGPRVKPWRLIVPWKPFPTERPETLIASPGSKDSTVRSRQQ